MGFFLVLLLQTQETSFTQRRLLAQEPDERRSAEKTCFGKTKNSLVKLAKKLGLISKKKLGRLDKTDDSTCQGKVFWYGISKTCGKKARFLVNKKKLCPHCRKRKLKTDATNNKVDTNTTVQALGFGAAGAGCLYYSSGIFSYGALWGIFKIMLLCSGLGFCCLSWACL